MSLVGHTDVRRLLETALPPVVLLRGPQSVGKWTLARHLAVHHRIRVVDQLVIADKLTIAAVHCVTAFVRVAPFGPAKLVTVNLDGASDTALHALLKTLEEPPDAVHFLLVGSQPVPATVLSRCQVFTCGLLTDEQVRQVLVGQGMTARAAVSMAAVGRGQVDAARPGASRQRDAVLTLMRAVATFDHTGFERVFRDWEDGTQDLLFRWLVEALTREWSLFSGEEFFGLDRRPALLRRMLLRLSQVADAQPRLGVRVALEPFLTPQ